ncbi:eukaryotic translation initiation factor 4 gamma 1 isoform X1 [Drosophila virilis]|uniref:eukaryotic translation initiation factor 4 gamma 1 isoform X1 n=1 Tax=Drosophila virilis TaxID=7244 RepID=UPI001395CF44|nr:eukaryotic translation initiation factor 4 gamma 1 isoform X1 [Drosophila virilis]XP_032290160.1 eukaryotic translation initiation factor 4 gamma 1 isoform X1 [Drosophila virilis]
MQPAAPTLSTQADIAKTMQPQNMILPTNKKTKKYASQVPPTKQQQPLPQHSTTQPQFQINKAYNVVSILKTTSTTNGQQQQSTHMSTHTHQPQSHHLQQTQQTQQQQQQQQQQQSYANVVNRANIAPAISAGGAQLERSTVICSGGNLMTVNNCQLNTAELNASAIYNLTGHRPQLAAANSGVIEPNCRFVGSVSAVSDMPKGPANVATTNNSIQHTTGGGGGASGSSNNSGNGSNQSLIALTNSHGIQLGASNGPYAMHEKSLLGVGVSVGVSCIDNRKYDYKNNNLLSNSSFQPAQEYVSSGNNSSGNNRSNQQSGIFRGPPPTSNTPRGAGAGGARHVHMPTMYPSMMLQQYPQFPQRQPTYQTPHIQYAPAPISYYPYQYLPQLQQQPPHTRSGVSVNTSVNIGNTMPGPNGPLAGPGASPTQLQLLTGAVQPGGNTVIGVSGTGSGQVGVGVPPMVSVMPANVAPQPVQVPTTSRRRHQHRLQIIDPATQKNILDDLDKSNASTDIDSQEPGPGPAATAATTAAIVQPDVPMCFSQPDAGGMCLSSSVSVPDPRAHYKLEQIIAQRQDIIMGQTPVVSAMSDAPSVEILPTSQKYKNKKISIVSPKDGSESSSTAYSSPCLDTPTKLVPRTAVGDIQKKLHEMHQEVLEKSNRYWTQKGKETTEKIDTVVNETLSQSALPAEQYQGESVTVDSLESISQDCQKPNSMVDPGHEPVADAAPKSSEIPSEIPSATAHIKDSLGQAAFGSSETSFNVHINTPKSEEVAADPSTTASEPTPMHVSSADPSASPKTSATDPILSEQVDKQAPSPSVSQPSVRKDAPLTTKISHLDVTDPNDPTEPISSEKDAEPSTQPSSTDEILTDETDRAKMLLGEETCVSTTTTTATATIKEIANVEIESATEKSTPSTTVATVRQDVVPDKVGGEQEQVATASESGISTLINYNEGQWSPNNPGGKKQYDREQLLQLREAKASRVQPEVKNVSILPHPNLMPLFMRNNNNNNNNKRVQSMVGMIGGNRNSDSGSNFAGKQVSMSGVQGRSSMKGMIHVNLSLNQDVKLNETENAWRPRLATKQDGENSSDIRTTQEKDDLVRRVRGILNKLTPERFDTLVEEIIKLKIDTPDKMDEVIVLVFEKAIDEPNFSVSYARLCHRLISEVKARDERMESGTKSNLQHFRNALLDKTEKEFTQNVSQGAAKEKRLQPFLEKIKKCTDPNEKAELEALLEEEERKIRRRSGGTVRFIGELFKISMLTGKIIYSCIDTLLNPHSEDMLECLCKLLTTVGAKFEQTPVNAKDPGRCYSLEKSITRMQAIASKGDKDGAKVSSRVRFMLQDVIDLRKNKWQTSRNEAPKTMGQIEKEAKNEQLSAQYINYSGSISSSIPNGPQSGSGSGKRDERSSSSRFGDSRSAGGYGGSHSQRGDGGANMRHQQSNSGGGGGSGSGNNSGGNNAHSNGNNDDNTWHVQTSKGSRSQAVDSNKLEGLTLQLNQNLDTKKMGGVNQFIWNNNANRQSSTPTTTPSNSFAALSSLTDKNSTDRDRDRSGPRNKGSYNKGSMERDRYGDRGMHSRTGSSQGSRENSSSRVGQNQQGRGMMNSSMQKSASHSKYTQQAPPSRHSNKGLGSGSLSSSAGIYRGSDQQPLSSASISAVSASQPTKGVAPPAMFIEPRENDLKLFKSVVSEMIELAAGSNSASPTVVKCIKRISEPQLCGFLFYILTDYLHLSNVGKQYRRCLAITVAQLMQQHFMSVDHFKLAYKEFSECANDLIVDIPELWLYIIQFAGKFSYICLYLYI